MRGVLMLSRTVPNREASILCLMRSVATPDSGRFVQYLLSARVKFHTVQESLSMARLDNKE